MLFPFFRIDFCAISLHTFFKVSTVALLFSSIASLSVGHHELSQSKQRQGRPWLVSNGKHGFIAPGPGDIRSPCPALNTLANHGYIDRSGQNITASSLISALTSIYHLSLPFSTTLVAGGFLCCGDVNEGISLHALAAHNRIEHDASLVHDNALSGAKFAPTQVNLTLVDELVKTYPNGMSIEDLADARLRREMLLLSEGRPHLNAIHEEIGHGEAALIWLLMKDASNVVKVQTLKQWYGVETFPETYTIPTEEISFVKAKNVSNEVGKLMKRAKVSHS